MGEYCKIGKDQVKLGTCEDLYYISLQEFNKRKHLMKELECDYTKPNEFRFRFPFPDEDGKAFEFDEFNRGVLFEIPKEFKIEFCHRQIFVRTDNLPRETKTKPMPVGFNINCPFDEKNEGMKYYDWGAFEFIHFEVVAQKLVSTPEGEQVQTVIRCPYCGAMSRLDINEAYELSRWFSGLSFKNKRYLLFKGKIIKRIIQGYYLLNK